MKKTNLMLAACAALAFGLSACSQSKTSDAKATEEAVAEAYEVVEAVVEEPQGVLTPASDDQFRPGQKVAAPTVLDFNATWCIPCRKLTPAFHKAADEVAGVNFYAVDVDNFPETAKAFDVQSIPMVVIIQPDGSYRSFVGLGDFASDQELSSLSGDALNEVIFNNLVKLINK